MAGDAVSDRTYLTRDDADRRVLPHVGSCDPRAAFDAALDRDRNVVDIHV